MCLCLALQPNPVSDSPENNKQSCENSDGDDDNGNTSECGPSEMEFAHSSINDDQNFQVDSI